MNKIIPWLVGSGAVIVLVLVVGVNALSKTQNLSVVPTNTSHVEIATNTGHIISPDKLLQSKIVSTATTSSTVTSLASPDGSKIISYNRYNGYPSLNEPATIFTIKDLATGQENKMQFVIPTENIGRGVDQWYWIDNRYVLISGDALILIVDTTLLKQIENLIGLDPKLSRDKKTLIYTEIEPPLHGTGSGKTKIKRISLPSSS